MEAKLASLCAEAVDATKGGSNILTISDRRQRHPGGDPRTAGAVGHPPAPGEGRGTTAGLVVETGTAREVHHFGVLAGYGAEGAPSSGDGNAGW